MALPMNGCVSGASTPLATASAADTVFEMEEESVDSDVMPPGIKYTSVYRFQPARF
jgi:hypothetical protein